MVLDSFFALLASERNVVLLCFHISTRYSNHSFLLTQMSCLILFAFTSIDNHSHWFAMQT